MLQTIGAACFGVVIGWITYRTLRRSTTTGLSDIATIIGAVGGAAVLSLFPSESDKFAAYCIGLAIGFFAYMIVSGIIDVKAANNPGLKSVSEWLGSEPKVTSSLNKPFVPPPSQ
jgi:uncharacterized membrane protein YeaQ/YmgE (transglycosylase-associated protein family)